MPASVRKTKKSPLRAILGVAVLSLGLFGGGYLVGSTIHSQSTSLTHLPATQSPAAGQPDASGFVLTPDQVAISIPFDPTKAVAGYLLPNDHVDILLDNGKGTVTWGFQDVVVLKIGENANGPGGPVILTPPPSPSAAPTATATAQMVVAVSRTDAALLTYIVQQAGSPDAPSILRFVVRPQSAWGKGNEPAPPVGSPQWHALFG